MTKSLLAGLIFGIMAGVGIWVADAEACACAPASAQKVPNQDCLTGLSYYSTGNCVSPDSAEEMQLLLHNLPAEKRLAMADAGKLPHSPNGYMYADNLELIGTNPAYTIWYVDEHLGDSSRIYRTRHSLLPTAPEGYRYDDAYVLNPLSFYGETEGGS